MKLAVLLALAVCLLAAAAAPGARADGGAMTDEQWLRLRSFPATPVVYGAEAEAARMRFAEADAGGSATPVTSASAAESSSEEEEDESSGADESSEASASASASGDEESEDAVAELRAETESSQKEQKKKKGLGYDVSKATIHVGRNSVLIAATKAVKNLKRGQVTMSAADAADAIGGTSLAGLSGIRRECPRHMCRGNSTCPLKGGICCSGTSHCCPTGATCLNTDPPTCVHDTDDEPNKCSEEECTLTYHCPHADVATCCLGGTTCCPTDFKCRATNPPSCEKILSPEEMRMHKAMEDRLLADKKAALADAITQAHAKKQAELAGKIAEHTAELKLGEAKNKKNIRLAATSHNKRERLNAQAASRRYSDMKSEVREKKGAVDTDRKERSKDAAKEMAEKRADTERRIAAHEKLVGHLDRAEAGRKRRDDRRLEVAAQERRKKEEDTKREQKTKEQKSKEVKAKQRAAERATKKAAEQQAKVRAAKEQQAKRVKREGVAKAAAKRAALIRQRNEQAGKEGKKKTHSRNVATENRAKEQQGKAHSRNKAAEQRGKEQQRKTMARNKGNESRGKEQQRKRLASSASGESRGKEQQRKRIANARSAEQRTKRASAPFDLIRSSRLVSATSRSRRYDLGTNVDYIRNVVVRSNRANLLRVKLIPASGGRRRVPYNHCVTKSRCVQNGGVHRYCTRHVTRRTCTRHVAQGCAHWASGRCLHYANRVSCGHSCRHVRHRYRTPRRRIRYGVRVKHCRRIFWHRKCWYRTHYRYRYVGGGWAYRNVRTCKRHCRVVGRTCRRYAGRRCVRMRPTRCASWATRRTCASYGSRRVGCKRYGTYRSCSRRYRWVGGGHVRSANIQGGAQRSWGTGNARGIRWVDVWSHNGAPAPSILVYGRRI